MVRKPLLVVVLVLAAAALVVVLGAASAFATMRGFVFSPGVNSKIAYIHNPRAKQRGL